jgi:hypothetical protein
MKSSQKAPPKLSSVSFFQNGLLGPWTASVVMMASWCFVHLNKPVSYGLCWFAFAKDFAIFSTTDRFIAGNASWKEAALPPLPFPPNLSGFNMSLAFSLDPAMLVAALTLGASKDRSLVCLCTLTRSAVELATYMQALGNRNV